MARIYKPDWREEKEREEIAARRKVDEAKRDPELEQCVIALDVERRSGLGEYVARSKRPRSQQTFAF